MSYVELHCHSAFSFLDGASLARGARGGRARARPHRAGAHRPRHGLGLDGVRAGRPRASACGRSTGRRSTLADGRHVTLLVRDATGWANLCRLLTRAHAHTRDHPSRRILGTPAVALDDLEEHAEGLVCLSGCARHGVHDEPTMRRLLRIFGPDAFRVELQRPFQRHDRALNRGLERAGAAARRAVRRDRQRPRAHACARAAAGRLRRDPRAHDARRLRAAAPRQPRPRARDAGGDGGALRRPSRRGRGDRAPGRHAALRPHPGPRLPLPGRRGPRGRRERSPSVCAHRFAERYPPGHPVHAEAAARLDEELRLIAGLGLSGFFLLHRDMLELAREVAVEVRGPDTVRALLPPGRGRGSSVSSIVCYLTGPLARRPDREQAPARALPQRGDHLAARHRPRLPARHPRGADPARARALRPRALGARRRLPDLPRARRDPRARQGARAAAGGDRARRARVRGLGGRRGRP